MIFDLTQQLKNQLNHYPQQPSHPYSPPKISPNLKLYATYSEDIFQLLRKIRNILIDNRDNYFSNASFSFEAFTDRQRQELNESIKLNLQSVLSQINQLSEGLKKQSWFRRKTEEEHMKAVVVCLYQLFKAIQTMYIEFEEFSLKRRKKIHESVSIDKQDERGKYVTPAPRKKSREFTDEELEKEASLLFLEKKSKQRDIEETKEQIQKIHELMSNMSNVVLQQQLKTEAFMAIGETGLFHIEKGNKNLIEANMLAKATGKWWSLLFLSMAFSLLILDFIKS